MKRTPHLLLMLLGLLLLAACNPVRPLENAASGEQPAPAAGAEAETLDPLVEAVALDLGVEAASVTIVSREAVEWPDACLGVTEPGEMCGQVITPGYRVVVASGGQQYTYHTDQSGSFVRRAADAGASSREESVKEQALIALTYAGPEEMGSDDTARCASLTIALKEAQLASCDGVQSTQPLPAGLALTVAEMLDRFAPFTYESPGELLTFNGRGSMSGPEWQAAILAWARMTNAELASGTTSASGRTALSWNLDPLPDQEDVCAHLTVLDYGYAYAEQRPCAGGDVLNSAGGWLEQEEMEQFSAWLRAFGPSYLEDNYLNGLGAEGMSEEDGATVAAWAQALWMRLAGAPLAPAAP